MTTSEMWHFTCLLSTTPEYDRKVAMISNISSQFSRDIIRISQSIYDKLKYVSYSLKNYEDFEKIPQEIQNGVM